MRAIVIILVAGALAMGALAAQPVTPPLVRDATAALAFEPVWMVLSGAALLVLAGIVRRLAP